MSRYLLDPQQEAEAMKAARERHDARFRVDNPPPRKEAADEEAAGGVARSLNYLWVVWLIIGLAGAVISLPHTIGTVTSTVALDGTLAVLYGVAAFIGVELGLIGVALVSALKEADEAAKGSDSTRKAMSLAGAINGLAARVGFRAPFNLAHLPDAKPATGGYLVTLLFGAALTFNLADAVGSTTILAPWATEIHFIAKMTAGVLGPGLLLIAGHRFAHEIVRATTGPKQRAAAFRRDVARWKAALQASWDAEGDGYVRVALAAAWHRAYPRVKAANPYEAAVLDEDEADEEGGEVAAAPFAEAGGRDV